MKTQKISRRVTERMAPSNKGTPTRCPVTFIIISIFICIAIAVLASFLASSFPDGLERIAANLGFEGQAKVYILSPISDYSWWSGIVGVVLVFAIMLLLGGVFRRKSGTVLISRLK